jgi:hypothetical protein
MSAPIEIEIRGLREFTRGLRDIDRDLPKAVRIANNKAAQVVVNAAKPRIPLGPGRRGHARDTLKAKSTRTAVRISAGGKRNPYYPWLDFGGRVGIRRSVSRPFIKEGRYIYPQIRRHRDDIIRAHQDAIQDLLREAGLT